MNIKIPAWVWALAFVCVGCIGAGMCWSCGLGKGTCEVIDVAKLACDTLPIRYLGPDGKVHVVHVPKSLLERTAEAQRLTQANHADAGTADGGAEQ